MDFSPCSAVDVTHICCTRCQNKQLPPFNRHSCPALRSGCQLLGSGSDGAEHCGSVVLHNSRLLTLFDDDLEGLTTHPHEDINTDFIRAKPQEEQRAV